MGANFEMVKFPTFLMTDERRDEFRKILSSTTEVPEEIREEYYYEDDESLEEILEDMLRSLDVSAGYESCETASYYEYTKSGQRIKMVCTGGSEYNRTELFIHFSKALGVQGVSDLAFKFSEEDFSEEHIE